MASMNKLRPTSPAASPSHFSLQRTSPGSANPTYPLSSHPSPDTLTHTLVGCMWTVLSRPHSQPDMPPCFSLAFQVLAMLEEPAHTLPSAQASFLDNSLNGCLGSTYYAPGSVLGAGAHWGMRKTGSLLSWSLHSSGKRRKINK